MGHADGKSRRLLRMIHLLRQRPWKTAELARALGVEQRSVQRYLLDLEALAGEMDLELVQEGNAYYLRGKESILTPFDFLFFYVTQRFYFHQAPSRHHIFFKQLEGLLEKFPSHIRRIAASELERYRDRVKIPDRVLEHVFHAWQERRVLEVDYEDLQGRTRRRSLEVWFVEVNRWNLSLYALARIREGSRKYAYPSLFKLTRMRNTRVLDETYEIPENFDPHTYLAGAWGASLHTPGTRQVPVRLRFAPQVARRLQEGDLPEPVERRREEDGSVELVYLVNTDQRGFPFEILGWVLSWGSLVEVREPENLRRRWEEEIARLATRLGIVPAQE
ncbi:WYL domain protein [Meiothermus luteus]|uniref:WYL domain protein n=1 Tax=Meiothermus luteus TaxID=2026184 RepID=A0A399EKX7_9DEIN|nr:WYL domain-containing protein [Meiothermus luteus]RIH82821.1 WYL domain protein [Meiothermus luteus]